mgnify:CR=1 FL=1
MFAMKLTLIVLGVLLYLIGTAVGFIVGLPALLSSGDIPDIIGAFAGFVAWVLITFGFIIHIIKTARPTADAGR